MLWARMEQTEGRGRNKEGGKWDWTKEFEKVLQDGQENNWRVGTVADDVKTYKEWVGGFSNSAVTWAGMPAKKTVVALIGCTACGVADSYLQPSEAQSLVLQLKGSKTMTVFPADDEELAPGTAHEAFHNGGHRNLQWRDDFAARGKAFDLPAGKAIYVPVKAPHWVKNGPVPSLSLSITWQSEWAYREQYARAMNATLRRFGLNPAAPKRFPHQNHAKSLAWRTINKVQRTVGR